MGIISVVVRTHDGTETWGVWDNFDAAHQYAIDSSANSLAIEWTKVVEALGGDPANSLNAVLGYYEGGVAINPDSGQPWPPLTAPPQ